MRCRKLAVLTMVGILFSTLTLSGCSANCISLADQGLVFLRHVSASWRKGLNNSGRFVILFEKRLSADVCWDS